MSDEKDDSEIHEIDCLEAIGHLYAYLDGEISDETRRSQIKQHLDHCKSCYSRSQMEMAINNRLQSMGKTDSPETLQERLRNVIDKL
jgi:anti-sigma factor (TIGR02949 family)